MFFDPKAQAHNGGCGLKKRPTWQTGQGRGMADSRVTQRVGQFAGRHLPMLLDRCVQKASTICNIRMGVHAIGSLFPITIAQTRPVGIHSWESVTQYVWYGSTGNTSNCRIQAELH